MTTNQKKNTKDYELPHGWSIALPDKVDLLQNKEGKIAILLKSKNFGDVSSLVFEVFENVIRVQSVPQFVEDVSFTLKKDIEVTFNPFIFQEE